MSELGMDSHGDIRTAYEFKDLFDDSGISSGPYKCPFCDVDYEARCIVTQCVKAPHFKLPNGTKHRGICEGEPDPAAQATSAKRPSRRVVGDVDIPEALVARRPPRRLQNVTEGGISSSIGASEIRRRRALLSEESTLASKFTSSLLRSIVAAQKRLLELAQDLTVASGHASGTPAYKATFRKVLESYHLELYGQKLNYQSAFFSSKLTPITSPRIYHGTGAVTSSGEWTLITDRDLWTREFQKPEKSPFTVKVARALPLGAVPKHVNASNDLMGMTATNHKVRWSAYGVAQLDSNQEFFLLVESLDHLHWERVA